MLDHLGDFSTAAQAAIVTGDPDRVPVFVEALGGSVAEWRPRGFHLAEVKVDGTPLIVGGTGIGGPSTAIVVEEFGAAGVTSFVRVGTCGSLGPPVSAGQIVISTGSVRDDGTSHQYLPPEFPAVPDFTLLRAIAMALGNDDTHLGLTHCKDAYYAENADRMPMDSRWATRWALLRRIGVLATEMEVAPLFTIATARGWRAAGLFVAVDGSLTPQRRQAALLRGLDAAVAALLP